MDDYFSTKIYEFTTNCRACGDCEFKIRTNPKERTFDYTSGIRKKVEEFDSAEAGTHGVIDTEFGNGILQYKNGKVDASDALDGTADALHLLEKNVSGHRKAMTEHEHMNSLIELNSRMDEDADANATVRASFRKDRKAKKRRLGEAAGMGLGRGIELSGVTKEDESLAKQAIDKRRISRDAGKAYQSEKDKFRSVRTGSIFGSQKSSKQRRGRRKTPSNEKTEKDNTDEMRKKSVQKPAKRKITIRHQKPAVASTQQTKNSILLEPSSGSDDGALAALSSCYASDSD